MISGYTALVDRAKVGASEAVTIEMMLERHDDDVLNGFGAAIGSAHLLTARGGLSKASDSASLPETGLGSINEPRIPVGPC